MFGGNLGPRGTLRVRVIRGRPRSRWQRVLLWLRDAVCRLTPLG